MDNTLSSNQKQQGETSGVTLASVVKAITPCAASASPDVTTPDSEPLPQTLVSGPADASTEAGSEKGAAAVDESKRTNKAASQNKLNLERLKTLKESLATKGVPFTQRNVLKHLGGSFSTVGRLMRLLEQMEAEPFDLEIVVSSATDAAIKEDIRRHLEVYRDSISYKLKQIDENITALKEAHESIEAMHNRISSLSETQSNLMNELTMLEKENTQLKAEMCRLQTENSRLQSEVEEGARSIIEKGSCIVALEKEVALLASERDRLQRQHDEKSAVLSEDLSNKLAQFERLLSRQRENYAGKPPKGNGKDSSKQGASQRKANQSS